MSHSWLVWNQLFKEVVASETKYDNLNYSCTNDKRHQRIANKIGEKWIWKLQSAVVNICHILKKKKKSEYLDYDIIYWTNTRDDSCQGWFFWQSMFLCGWRIIEVIGNFCSSRANRARSLPLSRPKIFSFQKINWTVQYLFSFRWLLSITQSFHIFIFGWVLGDDLWLENTRTMIYGDKSHESWVRHNS